MEQHIQKYGTKYIQKHRWASFALAEFLVMWYCNQHTIINMSFSDFKYAFLEVGDIVSFNSLIDQEKESLKKSQAIMESEQNAGRQFSKQYLLAQAAAQISFEKIQLAYTYAAIAQGGEGSARTISDTDFANSILSLFRAQGRELAAVMRGIELQLVDERDRIQQIISFSGTGEMSDFTRIAQRAGRDIRKVRKVTFGIGRGFGSGAIEPTSFATDP